MSRYLDPKSDFIFKRIFGEHPKLLKDFPNAVLPLPQDCVIQELTYLPTENVPESGFSKHSIVDVRCLDNHGRHFIVEMQLQWINDFIKRMLFNTAATYVRQLKKGELYKNLTQRFHDFRNEEVAKADGARQVKKLDDGCMSTYCSSPSSSLTQHPSDFPASAVERNEIFGLSPVYGLALIDDTFNEEKEWYHHYRMAMRTMGVRA